MSPGSNQERLKPHPQTAILQDIRLRQHAATMGQHVVGEVGKEGLRTDERTLEVHNAVDGKIADVQVRHSFTPGFSTAL
jgi:hypothetical protein